MKKQISRVFSVLLAVVIFSSTVFVNAEKSVTLPEDPASEKAAQQAGSIDEAQVKTLLQNYFDAYYLDFFETKEDNLPQFARDYMVLNESTNQFLAFHEWEVICRDLAKNWYESKEVTLNFTEIKIAGSTAEASLTMNLKYKYSLLEQYSYRMRVPYRFSLVREDGSLKIDSIQTDSDDFKSFYQDYEKEVNHKSGARSNSEQQKTDALEKVKQDYIDNTKTFVKQLEELDSQKSEKESDIPEIVPFSAASYNASDATR